MSMDSVMINIYNVWRMMAPEHLSGITSVLCDSESFIIQEKRVSSFFPKKAPSFKAREAHRY